ncbi:hypothetical protein [Methanosarcina sp. UBA411]|uniref:hypothetical protein n=1 Tax=Methanosarcina sp. UBA411 TaxID=1915589 RepID=UPI0025F1A4DE|nr:hypothetical protein [Methanosarcina sp. UBA411]
MFPEFGSDALEIVSVGWYQVYLKLVIQIIERIRVIESQEIGINQKMIKLRKSVERNRNWVQNRSSGALYYFSH